jgi:hypothetical protein
MILSGGISFEGDNVEEKKIYKELYISSENNLHTNNPLYLSSNSVLGIKRDFLIGTNPEAVIQIPGSMIESYDDEYIKLKMTEGGIAVADNGGLVMRDGELMLSTEILGRNYDYQIRIGSGLQTDGNEIRVNPLEIIGSKNSCSIIVPSENFTRDAYGKAHLIFPKVPANVATKDEVAAAIANSITNALNTEV